MDISPRVVLRIGGAATAIGLILLAGWLGGGDTWVLVQAVINPVARWRPS